MERLKFGNVELVEMKLLDRQSLSYSTWAHRGWTYQEGFLSKRRLIFTDDQISFLCNETCRIESARFKRDNSMDQDGEELSRMLMYSLGEALGIPDARSDSSPWEALTWYTQRKLTYETDILNACRGVLNITCAGHYGGIPIEADDAGKLQMDLTWYHDIPVGRRADFPTWSWTSCPGQVLNSPVTRPNGISYKIRLRGFWGVWETIEDHVQDDATDSVLGLSDSEYIRITAPLLAPAFVQTKDRQLQAVLQGTDGTHEFFEVFLDEPEVADELLDVVALGIYYANDSRPNFSAWDITFKGVLVKRVGMDYKRVGLMQQAYCMSSQSDNGSEWSRDRWPLWLKEAKAWTVTLE